MSRPLRWLLPVLVAALCLFAAGAADARAQAPDVPQVSVSLDKTKVTVGDPIHLTVTVRHAQNVTIDTTSIDDQLGPFEPLGSEPPEERAAGSAVELRLRYTIAVYHTGPQLLPQLTFAYTSGGAQAQATSSGPVRVTVDSVVPAGETPADIKPLKPQGTLPAPASLQAVWAGAIALVVFAAVAIGAGVWLLARRARRPAAVPAPSSAELARAELERIVALDLPAHGALVEHYRLLGGCIRRYLTDRFGFPAQQLTSSELAAAMQASGVSRWAARLVSGLLSECDNVVYARYTPAEPRLAADNAMAFEIVDTAEGTVEPAATPARVG